MTEKVYLFATCLCSATMPNTVLSAIKLLRREGVEIIFKKDQTCCSQPSYNSGFFEESRKIAAYNIKLFGEDESIPIVVPSGSCAGMLSHDLLRLFKNDSRFEQVKKFCSRIYDLSQYLNDVLHVRYEDRGSPLRITWHTSCHGLRVQKCVDSSKALIAQLEHVELVPLKYEEECCGFGGTFSIKEPEISNAIVQSKISDIEQTGARLVIAGDAACILNINGALRKNKSDIKVVHLYDFILDRIEGRNAL